MICLLTIARPFGELGRYSVGGHASAVTEKKWVSLNLKKMLKNLDFQIRFKLSSPAAENGLSKRGR